MYLSSCSDVFSSKICCLRGRVSYRVDSTTRLAPSSSQVRDPTPPPPAQSRGFRVTADFLTANSWQHDYLNNLLLSLS